MQVVKLTAENFKRIEALSIEPEGNTVEIVGKNRQGKSSILDAIFAAVGGTLAHPIKPIREGEKSAFIELDLGRISITRTFKKIPGTGVVTTALTVKGDQGSKFPSPQTMLNDLTDKLTFDPLAFSRMTAKEQYEEIKKLCRLNFDEQRAQTNLDYSERTIQNRLQKQAYARADLITVGKELDLKDDEEILMKLKDAAEYNAQVTLEIHNKESREAEIQRSEETVASANENIKYVEEQIGTLNDRLKDFTARRDSSQKCVDVMQNNFATAYGDKELTFQETGALEQSLYDANQHNRKVVANAQALENKNATIEEAGKAEVEADRLTAEMQKRKEWMQKQIEEAEMPIPGLTIDDGIVLYQGIPLDQCAGSDIVRISCAIAMSQNPKLRVLLVRDANGFDEEHLDIFRQMAKDRDFQVWMERVANSGEVGIEIRDGRIYENEEGE